ncbi:HNH endonuclease [Burkholderia gladioli]|uniref:HNH endonuclease n=1 Tax=Burkholderia gladioli TaxID=28095 RepID=UPI00285BE1C8|nr:HNH endonuclease [Burkholderia gladioli]MDR8091104.1 HNH endonuclease [Burkholderia gladioli]
MYEGRKVQMLLHRVIWKLVTGDDPGDALIDHRDCDGYNNRWSNLRLATKAQNSMNRDKPATNSSGVKGVGRFRKKWRATIKLNDRAIHLGSFDTIEEAALVRKRAEATYFGSYRHRT